MKNAIILSLALTTSFLLGLFVHGLTSPMPATAAENMSMGSGGDCEHMHDMMKSQMRSDADKGFMHAMKGMHESMMSMKLTGNADHDFMVMMIPHHQSAIDMAKVELTYGKDQRVQTLATNVISAQQKEIDEMHAWLASPAH